MMALMIGYQYCYASIYLIIHTGACCTPVLEIPVIVKHSMPLTIL